MQVEIIKSQEATKGFLGGKNVTLEVEITLVLSEQEKALIQKYYEPTINEGKLKDHCGTDAWSALKIIEPKSLYFVPLSKFRIVAHAEDGFHSLGSITKFVKGVAQLAGEEIAYLEGLGAWDGNETISI